MTDDDTDLTAFAAKLEQQAKALAADARTAEHEAQAVAAEPEPEIALDPNFSEKLDRSLAAPRQRMQEIARSAK